MPSELPSDTPSASTNRRNVVLFALLCMVVLAGVVAYALYSRVQTQQRNVLATPLVEDKGLGLDETRRRPHLLFRNTALGPSYGRLAVASLEAPETGRYPTPLACDRVYGTSKSGLCLQASRRVFTTYKAVSFDSDFRVQHTFNLLGAPSRTRVSRDGHMAASTVFVVGDSYAGANFSTRTKIFDLRSGVNLGDLEEFAVERNGQPFKEVDFNFWGVTFAAGDSDRFYATLATGGAIYLVEGHTSQRKLRVLREGVECPSLSPDGNRLVFKSRTSDGGRLIWRLRVLDLKTQAETLINEVRSVDDQAEWLDSDHVLYALPRGVAGSGTSDIWVARADGTGTQRVFVHDASSPCVVRP